MLRFDKEIDYCVGILEVQSDLKNHYSEHTVALFKQTLQRTLERTYMEGFKTAQPDHKWE